MSSPAEIQGRGNSHRRTVILVRPAASGGLLAHMRDEAQIMRSRGLDVIDAGPHSGRLDDTRFIHAPITPGASLIKAVAAIRAIRTAAKLSAAHGIAHAHGVRAGALSALALAGTGTPLVTTLHNAPPTSGAGKILSMLLHRVACARSATVLAVSPDLANLARNSGATNVHRAVIPACRPEGGTDGTRWQEATRGGRSQTTSGQPTTVDELTVLVIARLAPQKGLDVLLDAVGLLTPESGAHGGQRLNPVRVLVAGDGPLRARLHQRISAEGLPVTLLGHRIDIPDLLRQADIVVQPSLWEGQPVAIQEALLAHRPVVATDAGGTRWVTENAAVLVPPNDPKALAEALSFLSFGSSARERRRELSDAAARRARTLPTLGDLEAQLVMELGLPPAESEGN